VSNVVRSPRRRLSAAARRETILEAATDAFTAHGYDTTKVAAIAAAVGVTEPVVFQNFGTKADLFAAVLDRSSAAAAESLTRLGDAHDDPVAMLNVLLSREVHDPAHAPGGAGIIYAEADARPEPSVREAYGRTLDRLAGAIAEVLRRGQAGGGIRDDVDPEALAWLVLSLVRANEFRRRHTTHHSTALEHDLLAAILATLTRPG
jgi:AcrR family transcriptional regulator